MADYGADREGRKIEAPQGWRVLLEGATVPNVHREFIDESHLDGFRGWCEPRRCTSTMTPITARLWGSVRAFAVPDDRAAKNVERIKLLEGAIDALQHALFYERHDYPAGFPKGNVKDAEQLLEAWKESHQFAKLNGRWV